MGRITFTCTLLGWAAVIVSLAQPVGAQEGEADDWTRFYAPQGHVAVSFPQEPRYERRITSTIVGDVETDVWSARSQEGVFTLAYSYLPTLARVFSSESGLYEEASAKLLEELGGEVVEAQPIRDPFWEYDLVYQVPATAQAADRIGHARFKYIDGTVVVVNAVVPSDAQGAADRYLRSVEPRPPT